MLFENISDEKYALLQFYDVQGVRDGDNPTGHHLCSQLQDLRRHQVYGHAMRTLTVMALMSSLYGILKNWHRNLKKSAMESHDQYISMM